MTNDNDRVIDTKGLGAYFLIRWKFILLLLLAGCILGGAGGYYRQSHRTTTAVLTYEEQLESAKSALSEEEIQSVEQTYSQYSLYTRRLKAWSEYLQDSILQNMDPFHYVKRDLQYSVVSADSSSIDAFSAALLGQNEYEEIAALLGKEAQTSYISELITVSNVNSLASAVTGTVSSEQPDMEASNNGFYRGILNVTVVTDDATSSDRIVDVIDTAIDNKVRRLASSGTGITIEKSDDVSVSNDSVWLMTLQQTKTSGIASLQSNLISIQNNVLSSMSDEELTYFELLETDPGTDAETVAETSEQEPSSNGAATSAIHLKKYLAAGACGGFLLALLLLLLAFLHTDKIRTEVDLHSNYGLFILQRYKINGGSALAGADWIRNLGMRYIAAQSSEVPENSEIIADEISRHLKDLTAPTILLAYEDQCAPPSALISSITEAFLDKDIYVLSGDPILDSELYKQLIAADGILFVETLGKSRRGWLTNLLEIVRRNGIDNLGSITIIDWKKYR